MKLNTHSYNQLKLIAIACALVCSASAFASKVTCDWQGETLAYGSETWSTDSFHLSSSGSQLFVPMVMDPASQSEFSIFFDKDTGITIRKTDFKTNTSLDVFTGGENNKFIGYEEHNNKTGYDVDCWLR